MTIKRSLDYRGYHVKIEYDETAPPWGEASAYSAGLSNSIPNTMPHARTGECRQCHTRRFFDQEIRFARKFNESAALERITSSIRKDIDTHLKKRGKKGHR